MKQSGLREKYMLWFAQLVTAMLCAVLFICANTNSSCMFYQPETPAELGRFSKIK